MIWRWLADKCIPAHIAPTLTDQRALALEHAAIVMEGVAAAIKEAREAATPPLEGTELAVYIRTQQGNQLVGRVVHMRWMH